MPDGEREGGQPTPAGGEPAQEQHGMELLGRLQEWYAAQCDGDREHGSGVRIESLDNPGWAVRIDLTGTPLEGRPFAEVAEGVGAGGHATSGRWVHCQVRGGVWQGFGDASQLARLLGTFLDWAVPAEARGAGGPERGGERQPAAQLRKDGLATNRILFLVAAVYNAPLVAGMFVPLPVYTVLGWMYLGSGAVVALFVVGLLARRLVAAKTSGIGPGRRLLPLLAAAGVFVLSGLCLLYLPLPQWPQ